MGRSLFKHDKPTNNRRKRVNECILTNSAKVARRCLEDADEGKDAGRVLVHEPIMFPSSEVVIFSSPSVIDFFES